MDRKTKPGTDILDLIMSSLPENEKPTAASKLAKLPAVSVAGSIHQFAVTLSGPITFTTYSGEKPPGATAG
ncbi:hypothetical protein CS062_17400 [Roseateles chitinivorans]|uniref:Uncharacterized protein n=1 Tax=Roseateles chitinivorans TaxID=2917965 RepID=A0A2G9C629_9BURK|nr:hypothetical protein [Roseateles chitinivorans]PIM51901.1 hypothetical protein CS062_17400 [Roseateles chitinivorans]